MLGILAALVRSRAGAIGAIVLGLILLIAAWRIDHKIQARRLERAAVALAGARADLVQSRANAAGLEAALAAQNAAVARLQSDARAREARAQAEVRDARIGRAAAEARALTILAARPSGERCAAADKLILENLR
jgi:hypothetical protein